MGISEITILVQKTVKCFDTLKRDKTHISIAYTYALGKLAILVFERKGENPDQKQNEKPDPDLDPDLDPHSDLQRRLKVTQNSKLEIACGSCFSYLIRSGTGSGSESDKFTFESGSGCSFSDCIKIISSLTFNKVNLVVSGIINIVKKLVFQT